MAVRPHGHRQQFLTAQIWGRLSADGKRRGRTRPVNDTWIAACCLAWGMPLATLNRKDYADLAPEGPKLVNHHRRPYLTRP